MKRDMFLPKVNIRMAVMDLCDITGYTEREMLDNLYDNLNRFFTQFPKRDRQGWPIYFQSEKYKIPHKYALSFLWAIKEGIWNWSHLVDIDEHGLRVPETKAVAFEHFYLSLPDLLLFLSRIVDSDDLEALRAKWKYGVVLELPPSTGRESQKSATESFKEKLQHDANVLAAEWDEIGMKYTKQTIANELIKRKEYRGKDIGTLLRGFDRPRNFPR